MCVTDLGLRYCLSRLSYPFRPRTARPIDEASQRQPLEVASALIWWESDQPPKEAHILRRLL